MAQVESGQIEKIPGRSKKYSIAANKIDKDKKYSFAGAVKLLKDLGGVKFNESVDLSIRLGVDPKHPEQMVRGSVLLPAGSGKNVRVLVISKGDKEKEAKDAGADYVGFEDMLKKIQEGWLDFDKLIATPDVMSQLSKLGKILGPRGLMPNPKTGTVTFDVGKAVSDAKKGKVEFKIDKAGNLHILIGKKSFAEDALLLNLVAVIEAVVAAKPPTSKGVYLKSITLSTTMGPGLSIDPLSVKELLQK